MPLILLGLILIVGLVIYGRIVYSQGDEDTRPVRERYSHVFDKMKKGANYTVVEDDDDDDSSDSNGSDGSHTMYFPTDAELEKRKRNIH